MDTHTNRFDLMNVWKKRDGDYTVHAGRIVEVGNGEEGYWLQIAHPASILKFNISEETYEKYRPNVEDYFIAYDNGNQSAYGKDQFFPYFTLVKDEVKERDFIKWPKIPRDYKEVCVITEKLHGTNACLIVEDDKLVAIQSRKNFIVPEWDRAKKDSEKSKGVDPNTFPKDNHGLASWAWDHEDEIATLGDGYHFGEWVGSKINGNKYRLSNKRFFLFNTYRWADSTGNRPECLDVVPVLSYGFWTPTCVAKAMEELQAFGSQVEGIGEGYDGWTEGVVTYYMTTQRYVKSTHENERGKWAEEQDRSRELRFETLKALYPEASVIGDIDYGDSRYDLPI